MRFFITGATGFIGRHILAALLADGHWVDALVRPGHGEAFTEHPRLRVLHSDLSSVLESDLRRCEVLIHLAAHGVSSGMDDWLECFRVNVQESLRLWTLAIESGVRRLVISGSCFEYGRSGERYDFIPVDAPLEPTGAYHASKAAATMAALGLAVDKNIEVIIARPFHVYGDGENPKRFWPSLKKAALAGVDFEMSNGEQIRDFVEVSCVAREFARLATAEIVRRGSPLILNIGSGNPCKLADFACYWWSHWGAIGQLHLGAIGQRPNEVMRYVPSLKVMDAGTRDCISR